MDKWKILLIDDDPGIRKVLNIALEDAGYEVLSAADGETGVELSMTEKPQIVLTDIRMPGIDGIEVLKRIKSADPMQEVIVVTAFSDIELAIKALQLDASDFITKPINDAALTVALKRAKDRSSTRRELRDYTEIIEEKWMQTAEELARTFHFQKILIESSIDGIMAWDGQGKIIVFNRGIEQMLGCTRQQAVTSMTADQFFPPNEMERLQDRLKSEEQGGKGRLFLFESTLVSPTGERAPVQLSASVLVHEQQEIGVVGFFRDLRDIRRLTEELADHARLLHQDKMISLGKLAASVVHEINNPLSGMLNYVRLMIKIVDRGATAPDASLKFRNYLSLMESELDRCSKIVSNLLAFSRKSKLEFKEVDLYELLMKSTLLSKHRLSLQNIRLENFVSPSVPKIMGDFNQLQQCVINLIFNAIDAMPDGGALTIRCDLDRSGKLVEISVEDTGCGVAKEDLPYIFDPFFTTKKEGKGLGLGLSTVYGIVDRHKGAIKAQSTPGKGSIFTITLPLKTNEPPGATP
ncbi:MAG: response regulator [Syntrophobacteraceae bacterium]